MPEVSASRLEDLVRFYFDHRAESVATRNWSEFFDRFLQIHRIDLCDLLVCVAKNYSASLCPACQARIRLAEGELQQYRGDWGLARQRYLEAFGLLRRLATREEKPSPARCAQMARCLYQLGKLAFDQGQLVRAERHYLSALRLTARAADDDCFDLYQIGLAEVYGMQGQIEPALVCLQAARTFVEAQRAAAAEQAACASDEKQKEAVENRVELRRLRLGPILHSLGLVQIQLGHFSEAEKLLQDCLGLLRPNENPLFLATVHHQLGLVYQMLGQAEAASQHNQAAVELAEQLCDQSRQAASPHGKADAESLKLLAASRHQAGLIAMLHGDHPAAAAQFRAALGIWQQAELQNKAGEAQTRHQLGMLYHAQHEYDQARTEYSAALALARECADSAGEGWTLYQLGLLEQELGHDLPARENYESSLQIAWRIGDRASEARGWHQLGIIAQGQRRFAEARDLFEAALSLRRDSEDRLGEAQTLYQLGTVCRALSEPDQAGKWFEGALALERRLGNPLDTARTLLNLGLAHQDLGQPEAALPLYEESLTIVSSHSDVAGQQRLLWQMANAWEQIGKPARAVECLRQLQQNLPPESPLHQPTNAYLAHLHGQLTG